MDQSKTAKRPQRKTLETPSSHSRGFFRPQIFWGVSFGHRYFFKGPVWWWCSIIWWPLAITTPTLWIWRELERAADSAPPSHDHLPDDWSTPPPPKQKPTTAVTVTTATQQS
ncbi:unnamed protein product [Vitrella brassicaformis CCMP3155]|uniref:Uncharacterized protein n=1 Tax=Vitrella brassicaformis (strain CCMP3155) TaxID=1169540 RepID=A0A0G4G5R2_VITBC|nr:unnamed protein product [Vitrella brassicaformis CCMP3155]|eukprot:CEM23409.1 unnamed protein product [Vitrella brassicaformis CCMP3155]